VCFSQGTMIINMYDINNNISEVLANGYESRIYGFAENSSDMGRIEIIKGEKTLIKWYTSDIKKENYTEFKRKIKKEIAEKLTPSTLF